MQCARDRAAGAVDKRRALTLARDLLMPDRPDAPDYPTDALGPLAEACNAISITGSYARRWPDNRCSARPSR